MTLRSAMVIFVLALGGLLQACSTVVVDNNPNSIASRRDSMQRRAVDLTVDETTAQAIWAVPFARIATQVYCDFYADGWTNNSETDRCSGRPAIEETGWRLLYDWRTELNDFEKALGLQFMAYGRKGLADGSEIDIVIGFRGTDATSFSDWRSNLRWMTRFFPGKDQYDVIHSHAKRMVDQAIEKADGQWPGVSVHKIFATGHSLGGGLAQLLAYSDLRVDGAVVFDPSPVTGYYNLVSDAEVNCKARVARIYERGEALQYVRNGIRQFYDLSSNITELEFDVIHGGGNPVANHSMPKLREGLEFRAKVSASQRVAVTSMPGTPDCDCYRLRRPLDSTPEAMACRAKPGY